MSLDMQSFKKKCKSLQASATKFTQRTDELLQEAIEAARVEGNFDAASYLLTAVYNGRMSGLVVTLRDYLKAHGPFDITRTNDSEGNPWMRVKKDKSPGAIEFATKRVPYYQWERPKADAQLDLQKVRQRFDNLMKTAHRDLSEEEVAEFDNTVIAYAEQLKDRGQYPVEEPATMQ